MNNIAYDSRTQHSKSLRRHFGAVTHLRGVVIVAPDANDTQVVFSAVPVGRYSNRMFVSVWNIRIMVSKNTHDN